MAARPELAGAPQGAPGLVGTQGPGQAPTPPGFWDTDLVSLCLSRFRGRRGWGDIRKLGGGGVSQEIYPLKFLNLVSESLDFSPVSGTE